MAENRDSLDEKNDDLDLYAVLRKFIRFFTSNGRLLIAATLTGLFCGIIFHFAFPKYYTGKLLIESTVLNNLEQNELIENWDLMLARNSRYQLQKEMDCSPDVVNNILGLSEESLPAQANGVSAFSLTVSVRDTTHLEEVQDAILNGMRNNDYVVRKVALRRANLTALIDQATGEIKKLDSSKYLVQGLALSEKKDNSPLILDVSGISKEKVELTEKLGGYREGLAFVQGVNPVLGFSAVRGPKPGLLTLIAAGLAGGFFIGYCVAIFRSLIRLSKRK